MKAPPTEQLRTIFEVTLPMMVRTRNIQGYVNLFTRDGMWCPVNAQDRYGREDIAVGLAAALADVDIDPQFTAQEILVEGPFGYVLGFSKEAITPHDGSAPYVAWSREVWGFRIEDGEYKIARLIYNLKQSEEQLGPGPRSPCAVRTADT